MKQQKIIQYVGEEWNDTGGYTEMEYNPWENAVIFRSTNSDGKDEEIWLDPTKMRIMIKELTEFVDTLEYNGVEQDKEE